MDLHVHSAHRQRKSLGCEHKKRFEKRWRITRADIRPGVYGPWLCWCGSWLLRAEVDISLTQSTSFVGEQPRPASYRKIFELWAFFWPTWDQTHRELHLWGAAENLQSHTGHWPTLIRQTGRLCADIFREMKKKARHTQNSLNLSRTCLGHIWHQNLARHYKLLYMK